jgi:hypothetical protein
MIIIKVNEPLNFTKPLYNNTANYYMLDFTGQSTKIGVFNFIAFFSHSAMYHNCAIVTFNFSVNVKYYKFMGAASPKFYFPFFILH